MRKVVIESPYAGEVERNTDYARKAMKDALDRGEAPLASHLLYTQVLDDTDTHERVQGISAGLVWGHEADAIVFYMDYGMSNGMNAARRYFEANNKTIEERYIL